ncbi:DUF4129 domain-containing protein [Nonomuraea sp. NPDC050328]|uniref:DUF4129 domain-containing protein n=1 Tax=Nonomuraea sp. NPDC050328 TaxID=3364361 RepID=UPI0037A866B5
MRTWGPVALAAAALLAVGLAAGTAGGVEGRFDPAGLSWERPTGLPTMPPQTATAGPLGELPPVTAAPWASAVGSGLLALFGLLLLVLAGFALRALLSRLRRPSWGPVAGRGPAVRDEAGEQARAAVRAGLAELDAEGDPRRAVIACWLRLERAAAEAGVPRLATDTPGDLVTRLLAGLPSSAGVDGAALERLYDAYRQARYAPHEVPEALRTTARAALAQVMTR